MREFPPHGGLHRAYRDGRIVYAHGGGQTNLEGTAGYHDALLSMVAELGGQRWGVLATIDDEALLTPEAEEFMHSAAPRLTAAGRAAVAFVLPQSATRQLMRAQWTRVFRDANCAIGFFETQAQAQIWLHERLAEADVGQVDQKR